VGADRASTAAFGRSASYHRRRKGSNPASGLLCGSLGHVRKMHRVQGETFDCASNAKLSIPSEVVHPVHRLLQASYDTC
jgi:hypothetical protein